MSNFPFHQYDPNESRYSKRIQETLWQLHKPTILSLHEMQISKNDILSMLASEHSFRPSMGQLVKKMSDWKMQVYKKAAAEPKCKPGSQADSNSQALSDDIHLAIDNCIKPNTAVNDATHHLGVESSRDCDIQQVASAVAQALPAANLDLFGEESVDGLAFLFEEATNEQPKPREYSVPWTKVDRIIGEVDNIGVDDDQIWFETATVSTDTRVFSEFALNLRSTFQGSFESPVDWQDSFDIWQDLVVDDRLFIAPLSSDPKRILDLGCSTGIWALDVAEQFPSASVLEVDLSSRQHIWSPANCRFGIDDIEKDWVNKEEFDLIHGRNLAGSIAEWPKLYRQIYEQLKPDGWVEMQDIDFKIWTADFHDGDHVGDPRRPHLMQLEMLMEEAASIFGKSINVATSHAEWMRQAGFTKITTRTHLVPLNVRLGTEPCKVVHQLCALFDGPEHLRFALTQVHGWTMEEVTLLLQEVDRELKTIAMLDSPNFYIATVVYAQKSSR